MKMKFVSTRNELTQAMFTLSPVNLRSCGRIYRDVFINAIQMEDGSGYSFNVRISYLDGGKHMNKTIFVKMVSWQVMAIRYN